MGGGGSFAIQIDNSFKHGVSGPCATFDSPQLSSTKEFNAILFEVWVKKMKQKKNKYLLIFFFIFFFFFVLYE
jgi:hypothetical protein